MALETGTYISDLVATNPAAADAKSQGDDHLRLLKSTLKASFPNVTGPVTATQAEINSVTGKAPLNSPAFFGTPTAPTATAGTNNTQLATTAFVVAASLTSSLPGQSGNAGKFITTDGTTPSWAPAIAAQAGNSGKVLTTNGTDSIWVTPAMKLIATVTPTVAATVSFASVFTSAYSDYMIIVDGVGCTSASNEGLRLRFSVGGALDTGSNYLNPTTGTTTATTATSIDTGAASDASSAKTNLTMTAMNALAASNKTLTTSGTFGAGSQYGGVSKTGVYTGAAVSGFGLFWALGGNFTATGTIRVYGITNA